MEEHDLNCDGPSIEAFAGLLIDEIRQTSNTATVLFDRERSALITPESDAILDIRNAYLEYCQGNSEARSAILGRWARSWQLVGIQSVVPKQFSEARDRLMPVVKCRGFFEAQRFRDAQNCNSPRIVPFSVLGEHLGVCACYDQAESIVFLTEEILRGWDMTFAEVMEIALRNLADCPLPSPEIVDGTSKLPVFADPNGYAPSRLALADGLASLPVNGNPIVMVPTSDYLLLAGSEDEEALSRMPQMAFGMLDGPHPIGAYAFCRDGGAWKP